MNWLKIDSSNGMPPIRCQTTIWTNGKLIVSDIWVKLQWFSSKKMHWKCQLQNVFIQLPRRREEWGSSSQQDVVMGVPFHPRTLKLSQATCHAFYLDTNAVNLWIHIPCFFFKVLSVTKLSREVIRVCHKNTFPLGDVRFFFIIWTIHCALTLKNN